MYAVVGAVVGFILSFLFTPVAAQGIAIVGTNPVSGMTLITVALTILTLVAINLKGIGGMFIALIVGCAVCTALSTAGALISDFKIGYWIGSTPRNQERWKFAGIILAALVASFVIPLMDSGYHFVVPGTTISNTDVLPAPQANMIAAVSKGLLEDAQQSAVAPLRAGRIRGAHALHGRRTDAGLCVGHLYSTSHKHGRAGRRLRLAHRG